jgi:carbon storage regulator
MLSAAIRPFPRNSAFLQGTLGMQMVITRKRDESIVIGDNIVVTVIDIRGDKVRLGIELPADMPLHRKEVYDAIRRHDAATPTPSPSSSAAPPPHIAQPQADKLDRFVAILEVKVGVPITRAIVVQALREAGLAQVEQQALSR